MTQGMLGTLQAWVAWLRTVTGRFPVQVGLAMAALLVVLLRTYPLTFWEHDELLFAAGVVRFEPLVHHPHPPGYPVLIGLGRELDAFFNDPFRSLVVLSVVSSLVGFLAFTLAFRNLLRDDRLAIVGGLLCSLGAGALVHATLPLSEPPAFALLGLAVYGATRLGGSHGAWWALLFGGAASLAVGCRPQLVILVAPLLVLSLLGERFRTRGMIVIAGFAVVSVLWLAPLVEATGGLAGFKKYQAKQLSVFTKHDADLSRSGRTPTDLMLRFVAHPWGPKLLSMPVLACAVIGLVAAVRGRELKLAPLVVSSGLYLALAIATMDPADGVRYALPATMATALLAARGVGWVAARYRWWRPAVLLPAVLYGIGSLAYVNPITSQRHSSPSPPVQAARYAQQNLPDNAVIQYETSLWPHANQLFSQFRLVPAEKELGDLLGRADVPLYQLTDGGSELAGAISFAWRDSDAFRKLTRNHFRVVSLIPLPAASRYRAVRGVYGPERTPEGAAWRWLDQTAEIELPDLGATRVRLALGLPSDSPLEANAVKLYVNQQLGAEGVVRPGQTNLLEAELPQGPATLRIESATSIVPAELPGRWSRDSRHIAVKLLSVNQLP